jgi:hypothetical protein
MTPAVRVTSGGRVWEFATVADAAEWEKLSAKSTNHQGSPLDDKQPDTIRDNADAEFALIWKHLKAGTKRFLLLLARENKSVGTDRIISALHVGRNAIGGYVQGIGKSQQLIQLNHGKPVLDRNETRYGDVRKTSYLLAPKIAEMVKKVEQGGE